MFSSKDLKAKLVYIGLGGMIAIIELLPSVTAQNNKPDSILYSKLEVVDEVGKVRNDQLLRDLL